VEENKEIQAETLEQEAVETVEAVEVEANEAEAVKAISLAKDISISSVVVSLVKEGLSNEKYQTIIQAYRQFKNAVD